MTNLLGSVERGAAMALTRAAVSGPGRAPASRERLRRCFPDSPVPADDCVPGSPAPDDGCFPGLRAAKPKICGKPKDLRLRATQILRLVCRPAVETGSPTP
jgi:hypothetical protein